MQKKWQFKGDFSIYDMPTLLTTFMEYVLLRTHTGDSHFAEASLADGILIYYAVRFIEYEVIKAKQYHLEKGKYMLSSIKIP